MVLGAGGRFSRTWRPRCCCLPCMQDVIPTWLLYLKQYTNIFSILLIIGGRVWSCCQRCTVSEGWVVASVCRVNARVRTSCAVVCAGILCFIAYGLDKSDPSNLYLGIVLEGE